jgi:hypothetical protein
MFDKPLPNWLTGVWRRLSIETVDGCDKTTQVFWLQTHSCFGDIRIPANRPNLKEKSSFEELNKTEKIALSKQQGFAGITTFEEATCRWHRYIDYQPFSGVQDIGKLAWEGDILIEIGVEASYKEEWQKIDDGKDFTALVVAPSKSETWQGCLAIAGDYFIYIWNRDIVLPTADSLTTLMMSDRNLQNSYLNCEISFGVCEAGKVPWEIHLSTLPWREGQSLWSLEDLEIDRENGRVRQAIATPQGEQFRHWRIQEGGTKLII